MKKVKQRLLIIILTLVIMIMNLVIPVTSVQAAVSLPEISGRRYISTYTYSSTGKVYAFSDAGLSKKTGGYIACATDECRILQIKGNAVQVSYPVSGGRRTAWFARDKFTYRDLAKYGAKIKFTSTKQLTTYKWKGKNNTYGYIAKGDACCLLRGDSSSDWLQVIYPTGSTYKMAWVKGSDIKSVLWPGTNSISLNKNTVTLNGIGSTETLRATVTPSNSTECVSWSSSNTSVASVNSSGTVTARKNGTAKITANTVNGKTASVTGTVKIKSSKYGVWY